MSLHLSSMRFAVFASLLTGLVLVSACGDDDDSAAGGPSCAELKTQVDACTTLSQSFKDSFLTTCAEPRITAACRSCLNGKVCGVTENCDRVCGK